MRKQRLFVVLSALGLVCLARAEWNDVDIRKADVVQVATETVAGKAKSLLPPEHKWKLVWNDEFDQKEIDKTKWMCRESFWGQDFPAFAHDFEGVEMTGETVRLHLLRKGDDFCSPHLQTGSLTYDIPKDTKGFWPFGKWRKPLFMKKYGYFEIRCRQPKYPGWHSAFWLQSPSIGAHPDAAFCGVETDIMENYRQHTDGKIVGGNGWDGYGKDTKWFGHFAWDHVETSDEWHYYGCHWSEKGYAFYCDGKKIGEQNTAVSHVPEFILVSTEPGGYRKAGTADGGLTAGRDVRVWGQPDPRLFDVKLPDFFEVDFVRVYDVVRDEGREEGKKILLHSWDLLDVTPEEVLANADAFAQTGSDGVALNPHGRATNGSSVCGTMLMCGQALTKKGMAAQVPVLRDIANSPGLRDSLLMAFWIPNKRLAWTDDAAWRVFAENLAVVAWLAKESGLRGIVGDFEDYYKQKQFFLQPGDPDFDTAYELARRRGRETFGAMFAAYPEMTFLTFQLFTVDVGYLTSADPVAAMRAKGDLLPAYFNGMLDVLPPTVKFADGNESYGYHAEASKGDFYRSVHDQITTVLPLVAPENRAKYRGQLEVSFGLYIDSYVCSKRSGYWMGEVRGSRLLHFEENLSQALEAADNYVWIYGEKHSWIPWKNVAKSRPLKMTVWDEELDGAAAMMRRVKDPAGFALSEYARLVRAGKLENLIADPACDNLASWGTWQREDARQGRYHLDPQGGVDGSSALAVTGAESGCFIGSVKGVKVDEIYAVVLKTTGKASYCTVQWRKSGAWVRRDANRQTRFGRLTADGWRQGGAAVRVPGGVDELCFTFGAGKLGPDETVRFDDIAVFRVK